MELQVMILDDEYIILDGLCSFPWSDYGYHISATARNGLEGLEILEQADIIRVYAAKGKVYAVTAKGEYLLRMRLYEAEERLDQTRFVRISNSEIINLKMAKRFDLSFSGTICVNLAGGQTAYVSRRYVAKIKRLLGI